MNSFACAKISGTNDNPRLKGIAKFYKTTGAGIWIAIEVSGLPTQNSSIHSQFYGLHIHEKGDCTPPFENVGSHYNPRNLPHPDHAGDLPPLLGSDGYAYSLFYTGRLTPDDVINRSIVIHSAPDDFHTQPAGNSGTKIGCGVIRQC